MKIAILDLGTNTFHLLIAKVNRDRSYEIIFKTRAVVKLGKGGIAENRIAAAPFRKGILTIRHFKEQIEKYKVDRVFAFATSAIRSSSNGKEFVRKVKEETGIKIKIISGDEEAKLIYYGVRQCVELGDDPALIVDIGGGSTEFIIANDKQIFWKQSFNIGAARLLDQFKPSDPMKKKEMNSVEKYLDRMLKPLMEAVKKYPVKKLVGSSGSFDSLAEMIGYRFHNRNVINTKTAYRFDLEEYNRLHDWLARSTFTMRMKSKGLIRMRVDMIVLSSICTNYMLKKLHLEEMVLSKYALKEGALWEILKQQQAVGAGSRQ